jgi:leucyl aminopeptidase (aminopeptidase T)
MPEASELLARAVLQKNLRVTKGESVLIESWPHSLEYARAFVEEARRLGAQPTMLYEDEQAWWSAVDAKRFGEFTKLSPAEKAAVGGADVYIYFWGPGDQARVLALPDAVREKIVGFNDEWYRTAKRGGLRGCRMSLGFTTDAVAAKIGFAGPDLREKVALAGAADTADIRRKGDRVAKAIAKGKEVRIRHSNGTDLRLELKGRHHRVDTGLLDAAAMKRPQGMLTNNPSGLVLVSLDRSNASGTIVGNRPVYDFQSYDKFDGAEWTFEGGRLIERSMKAGSEIFEKGYSSAKKGRDRLGYFSIGLNPSAREVPPAEDCEEGAVLVTVGNNQLAGGSIRIPFRGYAMIGEAQVEVDGVPIALAGKVR